MILKKLHIELETYGPNRGKYTGVATFGGEAGSITLNLNEHHIEEIFRTCADSIIETSKAAARHLTTKVISYESKSRKTAITSGGDA